MDWKQEAVDKLEGYEVQRQAAEKLPAGPERTKAQLWASMVEGGLSILEDEERLVLDLLFIRRPKGAIDLLCDLLSTSKSAIYRRRDEALRRFTMALYGALESV